MLKQLLCVRHGQAFSSAFDPDRSLTAKGIEQIQCLAQQLQQRQVTFTAILHSDTNRTLQTANLIHEVFPRVPSRCCPNLLAEESNCQDLLTVLDVVAEPILLVSHLPFLQQLVNHLCGRQRFAWPPGMAVSLMRDQTQPWQIDWQINPDELIFCNG